MKINGVNSDDYIYFKIVAPDENFPLLYTDLKEGTILRFKVDTLKELLWREKFLQHLDCFKFIPNPDASKFDFSPKYAYERIEVVQDIDLEINVDGGDILLFNQTLWDKMNSSDILNASSLGSLLGCLSAKSPVERNHYNLENTKLIRWDGTEHVGSSVFLPDKVVKLDDIPYPKMLTSNREIAIPEKIVDCYQFSNCEFIVVPLRKGEVLDFNNLVYNLLFLKQDWMRLISCSIPLTEEEHLKYFEQEFVGYIPEADRRYFKLHDYIKIHSLQDLFNSEVFNLIRNVVPTFKNYIDYFDFNRYSSLDNFDFDSDGYLRYVHCGEDEYLIESELAKIGDRLSYSEGKKHFEHENDLERKIEQEKKLKIIAEYYIKAHRKKYIEEKRRNPSLTDIEFMQTEENKQIEVKKILVKRLIKTLDNRISKINSN